MRDVFEGQLKQRRVPPVAACLLHMMLPSKSCKFKHETTFTLDKKRRKFYNHSSRASSCEQALHFEWRANARANSEARKSGGNRELSLFIPLLAHGSPCACRPRVTSHNSLKLRACSQATQDAMPRSHHINRVKREKQISASSKQSFDITKAG